MAPRSAHGCAALLGLFILEEVQNPFGTVERMVANTEGGADLVEDTDVALRTGIFSATVGTHLRTAATAGDA
eukprot:CAMPEP_0118973028 /NCGR_PEP_ID=MMETSP1173-20130426/9152_1 /TAXON_ID=1034831 /ORGANISM="Rhizochromulina marina cf, Strain CCMP1243" /LENGTH=71 /DNA_ID=CAMNT_0006922633 /DNA_START=248 /DNA_END=463 /DNA_ORIENTATION=-